MKPNVQYLLECYMGDKLFETSDVNERSTDDKEYYTQKFCSPGFIDALIPVVQAANINPEGPQAEVGQIDGNQEANERIYASLNARQRQEIRHLARTLKAAADAFPIKPLRSLLAVEKAILQNEELDEDELQVVNNIHSIKSPTTVSTIAEYLGEKLTSRTFRAALRFICYSASSVPEELALVCELAKKTRPKMQLSRTDSIYDVISEFIEDKLNVVIH